MKLISYYPADSFIHRLNPVVKLVVTVVLVILVTFAYDVATPLIFLALIIALMRLAGGLPLRWIGGSLLPFLAISLGLFLSSALFHRTLSSETELFRIGTLIVSKEGVSVGLAVGLRVLFLAATSLLIIGTTEPTKLVVSLVMQGRVNYRLAFATLVAYRFVPLLLGEYRSIRAAARIRGQGGGIRGVLRDAIPLLAGAVRRAGRVALAMDSKAFAAYPTRTFLHPTPMRRADWLFLAFSVGGGVALFVALVALGITKGLGGQFAG
jgi:energy-coupling factor transport system permease protein